MDSPGPALRLSPPLGWRRKVAFSLGSLLLGLVAAEGLARAVHRGAFPYLNIFAADPRYGVRLQPSTSTRVRSRDGRITEIATNELGFRGPAWPRPQEGDGGGGRRVLLLGDSQV